MSARKNTNQTGSSEQQSEARFHWKRYLIGALVGGSLGFAYWYFIGCNSGSCPISSNPYISTFYGVIVGLVAVWK